MEYKNTEHIGENRMVSPTKAVRVARHVTWVGFWINAALGVAKIIGGITGRSAALIADGVHSFSDFVSDIIVIVMVGISHKRPDRDHQYGHGRYEALATLLLAIILIFVAAGIAYDGVTRIIQVINGAVLPRPGGIALIIIVISIVSKEWLYHYTRRAGERIHSDAVVANAWHHRSDAFSSIATLIGVTGAMFMGDKWRVLDPIAAIIVGIFILVVGIRMASPALGEMLGAALPPDQLKILGKALDDTPGVLAWHRMRTFKSGNDAYVEVHIKVDPDINVRQAHGIASLAERNMSRSLEGLETHLTTHIEPYDPQKHGRTSENK